MPFSGLLDFSVFHPLDHCPFTRECLCLPGGWANHLRLAWRYKWPDEIRYRTTCRLGWHRWCTGWTEQLGDCRICSGCWNVRET